MLARGSGGRSRAARAACRIGAYSRPIFCIYAMWLS
jgi:hypothetical protein